LAERPNRRRLEDKAGASAPRASGARRKPGGQGGARSAAASGSAAKTPLSPGRQGDRESARPQDGAEAPRDRGLRRAMFLVELAEARELRRRVAPRRARAAELHARLLRTFRY
jgi:hypothetical protein